MGIITAYKNYKFNYNTKFTTYAYPYILGEVIKYINDFRSIKVNKNSKILTMIEEQINNESKVYNGFENLDIEETFYNEIEEKMGEYGTDFYFGDIALIKNTQKYINYVWTFILS